MFTTQDILNSKHFTSKNIVLHELNLKETKERLANSFTRIIMDDKFSFDDVIGEAVIRNIIPNVEIIHSTKLVNELKYKNDKKTILVSKHLENSFKEYHVHNNKSDYRYIIIIANIISSSLNIPAPMAEYTYKLILNERLKEAVKNGNIHFSIWDDIVDQFVNDYNNAIRVAKNATNYLFSDARGGFNFVYIDPEYEKKASDVNLICSSIGIWSYNNKPNTFFENSLNVDFVVFTTKEDSLDEGTGKVGILSRNIPVSFMELDKKIPNIVSSGSKNLDKALFGFLKDINSDELYVVLKTLSSIRKNFFFKKDQTSKLHENNSNRHYVK